MRIIRLPCFRTARSFPTPLMRTRHGVLHTAVKTPQREFAAMHVEVKAGAAIGGTARADTEGYCGRYV